jgi:hypothetical protein
MKTHFSALILTTILFNSVSYSANKNQNIVKNDRLEIPLSTLQSQMLSPKNLSTEQMAEKYRLVRLWPFNNAKNLQDDLILGKSLFNTNFRVKPLYCGDDVYAKFENKAMIKSDETFFVLDYLTENKPSQLDTDLYKAKKGLSKLSEWFPNYLPSISAEEKNLVDTKLIEKYKSKLQYSSSMIEVESKNQKARLKDTDYTVGGWFKPQRFSNGDFATSRMTLLSKKFTNLDGTKVIKEWEIFTSGNVIYFHNYRDNSQPVAIKYLNTEQADIFRSKNQNFYGIYDYYDDVVERLTSAQQIDRSYLPPILPKEKSAVNKPIPIVPPPLLPPATPPSLIPIPVPPAVIVIPPTGKEYTSSIDLKTFWWATILGQCYGCMQPDVHSDIWHYISFSVHLNDPLGPYVDFWIIMDPNPAYFKSSATFLRHAKHLRWELNRQILSQPVLNPFQNGIEIERDCSKTSPDAFKKGSCLNSVLEIGSIEPSQAYSGYMRGIYIAKKALKEKEVLELAAEYYPNDSKQFCTYSQNPRVR